MSSVSLSNVCVKASWFAEVVKHMARRAITMIRRSVSRRRQHAGYLALGGLYM